MDSIYYENVSSGHFFMGDIIKSYTYLSICVFLDFVSLIEYFLIAEMKNI